MKCCLYHCFLCMWIVEIICKIQEMLITIKIFSNKICRSESNLYLKAPAHVCLCVCVCVCVCVCARERERWTFHFRKLIEFQANMAVTLNLYWPSLILPYNFITCLEYQIPRSSGNKSWRENRHAQFRRYSYVKTYKMRYLFDVRYIGRLWNLAVYEITSEIP
jgi:hypothetical protein